MRSLLPIATALVLGWAPGCSNNKTPDAPPAQAPAAAPLSATASAERPAPANSAAPAATVAAAADTAAPEPSAAAAASSAPLAVAATAEAPLPDVKVSNIGMHIGGGPNDAATKEPIKLSVEPHFDAFRRCYAHVESQGPGDFGVDLKLGKDGGKARLSPPRTAMKGERFTQCVVQVFEAIEFRKPRGGATVVSYSLRFEPGRSR